MDEDKQKIQVFNQCIGPNYIRIVLTGTLFFPTKDKENWTKTPVVINGVYKRLKTSIKETFIHGSHQFSAALQPKYINGAFARKTTGLYVYLVISTDQI